MMPRTKKPKEPQPEIRLGLDDVTLEELDGVPPRVGAEVVVRGYQAKIVRVRRADGLKGIVPGMPLG